LKHTNYSSYLEYQIETKRPDLAKRVYMFDTFFYNTLMNPTKGKLRISYESVQRWTAKVDLFSFDFVFVPVNEKFVFLIDMESLPTNII